MYMRTPPLCRLLGMCRDAPCLFRSVFNLDHILKSTINKLQTRASSFIKHWLNIQKCATLASLFHPEEQIFPTSHEKAKLRLVTSVHVSKDLNLKEMQGLISVHHIPNCSPTAQPQMLFQQQMYVEAEVCHLSESSKSVLKGFLYAVCPQRFPVCSIG